MIRKTLCKLFTFQRTSTARSLYEQYKDRLFWYWNGEHIYHIKLYQVREQISLGESQIYLFFIDPDDHRMDASLLLCSDKLHLLSDSLIGAYQQYCIEHQQCF